MAKDTLNISIKRSYLRNLITTGKVLAYTGGLYSFATLLVPDVLGINSPTKHIGYTYKQDIGRALTPIQSDWGDVNTDCTMGGECIGANDDSDKVKERVNVLFPELKKKFSLKALGSSGLTQVTATEHDLTFLITGDGNYLFTDTYFDLSLVTTSEDADKMIPVQLSAARNPNVSTAASDGNDMGFDVDEDLFQQEAFKWAVENTTIKYPAKTEESIGDIVVFADYSCPECREFHKQYHRLQERGYNLHIALLNRRGNSGTVFHNTQAIQCSSNPKANYEIAIETRSVALSRPGDDCTPYAADFYDMAIHFMSQVMERPGTPGIWVDGERFVNRIDALRL